MRRVSRDKPTRYSFLFVFIKAILLAWSSPLILSAYFAIFWTEQFSKWAIKNLFYLSGSVDNLPSANHYTKHAKTLATRVIERTGSKTLNVYLPLLNVHQE